MKRRKSRRARKKKERKKKRREKRRKVKEKEQEEGRANGKTVHEVWLPLQLERNFNKASRRSWFAGALLGL